MGTREAALVACFASLYAASWSLNLFPVIGAHGRFITASSVLSPILGVVLGPVIGTLTATVGGLVGSVVTGAGAFGPLSFIPGAATALCSGLLSAGRKKTCIAVYVALLMAFALYPRVGPLWLYPQFLWFQFLGVPSLAVVDGAAMLSGGTKKSVIHLSAAFFASTLFGHISGCLLFEATYWPWLIPSPGAWRAIWKPLTWIYPVERILITVVSVLVGVPTVKALNALGIKISR